MRETEGLKLALRLETWVTGRMAVPSTEIGEFRRGVGFVEELMKSLLDILSLRCLWDLSEMFKRQLGIWTGAQKRGWGRIDTSGNHLLRDYN